MSTRKVTLVAACDKNGLIGIDNTIPWRMPADLKRFKQLTTGHAIIMGRKTFESIGKALPNRTNIVLSSTMTTATAPLDVYAVNSLELAYALAEHHYPPVDGRAQEIMVIGGAEVYTQCIKDMTRLVLTEIDTGVDVGSSKGVYFPIDLALDRVKVQGRLAMYEKDEKNPFACKTTEFFASETDTSGQYWEVV